MTHRHEHTECYGERDRALLSAASLTRPGEREKKESGRKVGSIRRAFVTQCPFISAVPILVVGLIICYGDEGEGILSMCMAQRALSGRTNTVEAVYIQLG